MSSQLDNAAAAIYANLPNAQITAGPNAHLFSGNSVSVHQDVQFTFPGSQGKRVDFQRLRPCPPPSRVFTGRADVLRRMNEYFFSAPTDADPIDDSKIFVLHGLGGAGKTQIARKFIREFCKGLIVLAVDASSVQTLESSLKDTAVLVGVGETADDLLTSFTRLKEDWFLLLDNADDPNLDLHPYLPSSSHGKILITTRNSRAPAQYTDRSPEASSNVKEMDPQDARTLLRTVTRLTHSSDDEDIDALAQEVGFLALAMTQAGSAMCAWGMSVKEYLEELRERRSALFHEDGTGPAGVDGYQSTVYTTWRMSYDRLSPLSRQLFQMCSFLHNTNITENIFKLASTHLPHFSPGPYYPLGDDDQASLKILESFLEHFRKRDLSWDRLSFLRARSELSLYSLIEIEDDAYYIHPLVHQWTRGVVANNSFLIPTILLLSVGFGNVDDWAHELRTVHHIEHVRAHINPSLLPICVEKTFYDVYWRTCRHTQARRVALSVLEKKRRFLGAARTTLESMDTLESMHSLALILERLNQWRVPRTHRHLYVWKRR